MPRKPARSTPSSARRSAAHALESGGGIPLSEEDRVRVYRLLRDGVLDAALTLIDAARDGDRRAADTILRYALGDPSAAPSAASADGGLRELPYRPVSRRAPTLHLKGPGVPRTPPGA